MVNKSRTPTHGGLRYLPTTYPSQPVHTFPPTRAVCQSGKQKWLMGTEREKKMFQTRACLQGCMSPTVRPRVRDIHWLIPEKVGSVEIKEMHCP